MTFSTMTEIKAANKAQGFYWFSPDTIAFFDAKIEYPLAGGRFWIESTRNYDDSAREYKVCEVAPDGDIDYAAEPHSFDDIDAAVDRLNELLGV